MCNNESFNDSDEYLSLYGFKNVTKTYSEQLQKLLSQNAVCSTNQKINNTENFDSTSDRLPEFSDTEKFVDSPILIESDDCTSHSSVEVLVVNENTTKRRSERLKNKKQNNGSRHNNIKRTFDNCDNSRSRKRKNKNRSKKKQCANKQNIEVIPSDDSCDTLHNSEEEEFNPEVSIKVIWKSISVRKFVLRKFQKLSKIYNELSNSENIQENRIILTFKNIKVNYNDTPASLNLKVFDFLEGGVLSETTNKIDESTSENINYDDNVVVIKFQNSNKKIIKIAINKRDKIKVGMIKYAEQLEIPLSNLKLFFDGELLNLSETPESLGLENDDVIDVELG